MIGITKRLTTVLLASLILCLANPKSYADDTTMIAKISKTHPRILLTDKRVTEIKKLLKTDKELQTMVANLEKVGDCIIAQEPVVYKLVGVKRFRLLRTSRLVLSRSLVLGTLYRLDGKAKWKKRLTAELKAVCAFKDWYPTHFLDTAEMSAAVAFGYDWLHNDLSEKDRTSIRDGLIKLGVKPGVTGKHWWMRGHNNWNQVCHCGMALAAMAVAHDAPKEAEKLLKSAKKNYETGMKAYAPAGIYPEGPGYWTYGTSFSIVMVSAVQSVLGTDWGMFKKPGFEKSFDYRMHVQGPTGKVVNYADGGEGCHSSPYHLYLAQLKGTPGFRSFALETMTRDYGIINDKRYAKTMDAKVNRLLALAVAWYVPEQEDAKLPLDWFGTGKGQVHVAIMRSAWGDRKALFASLKGGNLTASHGHLDAGTFILEANGVRWASDLGSEKEIYDRSDSWSMKQDSYRWAFFRANNHGHNTLTIDNKIHRVAGSAPIIATGSGESPFAVTDLSAAFRGQAKSVKRGIMMIDRKQFLVHDEIEGVPAKKNVRWNLITRARLSLSEDDKVATFEYNRQILIARLEAPANAKFKVTDATTKLDIENQNKGYSRLIIDAASTGKPMTIMVLFTPGEALVRAHKSKPLSKWGK